MCKMHVKFHLATNIAMENAQVVDVFPIAKQEIPARDCTSLIFIVGLESILQFKQSCPKRLKSCMYKIHAWPRQQTMTQLPTCVEFFELTKQHVFFFKRSVEKCPISMGASRAPPSVF